MEGDKKLRLSYSSAFGLSCPRRIKLTLEGRPPEVVHDEPITVQGIEVHKLLKEYVKGGWRDKEAIRIELNEKLDPYSTENFLITLEKKLNRPEVRKVETEKKRVLDVYGVQIPVVPDLEIYLADGTVEVYDYKTSWGLQVRKEWKTQLKLYAFVLYMEGVQSVKPYVWILRHNILEEVKLPKFKVLHRQIKSWVKNVLELKDDSPAVGSDCWYCPYILSCPAGKDVVLHNEEDAKKEVMAIKKLMKEVSLRKARLRNWIEAHGNVIVDGREYGYIPRKRMVVDFPRLLQWVVEEQRDLMGVIIKEDKRAIAKYKKQYKELEEFIEYEPEVAFDGKLVGIRVPGEEEINDEEEEQEDT